MFANLCIAATPNGQKLLIDGNAAFLAKRITSAKFYCHNREVAVVFTGGERIGVAFITKGNNNKGFSQWYYELEPQPQEGTLAVLQVSLCMDLPFVHYTAPGGMVYISTQDHQAIGPFGADAAERILEYMRKKNWCFRKE